MPIHQELAKGRINQKRYIQQIKSRFETATKQNKIQEAFDPAAINDQIKKLTAFANDLESTRVLQDRNSVMSYDQQQPEKAPVFTAREAQVPRLFIESTSILI